MSGGVDMDVRGGMDRLMEICGRMDMYECIYGCVCGGIGRLIGVWWDGWILWRWDRWICVVGWMGIVEVRWMDGCICGEMNGGMDVWIDTGDMQDTCSL